MLETKGSKGVDPSQLLRRKFNEGEELFGFVGEVTVRGVSVHLSPRAQGYVPLMLAHRDAEVCTLYAMCLYVM